MIVPSFVAKVARAKEHLIDLEAEIGRYAARHPYTVRETIQGKKKRKVRRLVFTADPANTNIPIIAADAIYNLRSALDHLMSSLVPSDRRASVMFPVFFQGVWDPPVPGESNQRGKDRERWESTIKTLPAAAVAVLKSLQPPDASAYGEDSDILKIVNALSNTDRHTKLPVVASGLRDMRLQFTQPDGTVRHAIANPEPFHVFTDHAEIHDLPYNAMDMQIQGVPVVAIGLGHEKERRYIEIPDKLTHAAKLIEDRVIPALTPHVR